MDLRNFFNRTQLFVERRLGLQRTDVQTTPMWFLDDKKWEQKSEKIPPSIRSVLNDLRQDGYAILKSNFSSDTCDAVQNDFKEFAAKSSQAPEFRDEHGLYDRLACLHLTSEADRKVGFQNKILEILDCAFGRPSVVVGSLYFNKGSQQSIHRDTPAFFTNPINHFFGVWTALEDVQPGSGPLIYYHQGHKTSSDLELRQRPSIDMKNYFKEIDSNCRAKGLELIEFHPKKGDTLIWLPELPHGGNPIEKPGLSRNSIVFHYIASGVPIYGPQTFFDRKRPLARQENYKSLQFGTRRAIDLGAPQFFQNRYEGNFDE
jgi:phytanoyl-CoA hydroxylase